MGPSAPPTTQQTESVVFQRISSVSRIPRQQPFQRPLYCSIPTWKWVLRGVSAKPASYVYYSRSQRCDRSHESDLCCCDRSHQPSLCSRSISGHGSQYGSQYGRARAACLPIGASGILPHGSRRLSLWRGSQLFLSYALYSYDGESIRGADGSVSRSVLSVSRRSHATLVVYREFVFVDTDVHCREPCSAFVVALRRRHHMTIDY